MPIKIKAAELRTKLDVQRKPTHQGGTGTRWTDGNYPWDTIATINCRVRQAAGGEQAVANSQETIQTYKIVSRWMRGIKTTDRLYDCDTDTYYHIRSAVNDDGKNRWLVMTAVVSQAEQRVRG